jgi:hypothetical protein
MGTRFDVSYLGRVESTGCVTSGRRWHRRIPPFVSRFGAAIPVGLTTGRQTDLGRRIRTQEQEPMMKSLSRVALAAALAALTSACALSLRNPDIADLRNHPGRYQGRTVAVNGVVTSSWGLPLVPFRFYKVDDGTGEVTVLSEGRRMPAKGERVRVRGRVEEVALFGGRPLGLHLRERDLYVKR